jgi:hypothetical protein
MYLNCQLPLNFTESAITGTAVAEVFAALFLQAYNKKLITVILVMKEIAFLIENNL